MMLTEQELPPIPDYLSPEAVREYARAVERAAYERAASLCDKADKSAHPSDIADAIRALGRQHD